MTTALAVALISAFVAVGSAAISSYVTVRSVRLEHALAGRRAEADRREASQDVVRLYREPLLLAAFDLQTRLCNIVEDDFIARHLGSPVNRQPDQQFSVQEIIKRPPHSIGSIWRAFGKMRWTIRPVPNRQYASTIAILANSMVLLPRVGCPVRLHPLATRSRCDSLG